MMHCLMQQHFTIALFYAAVVALALHYFNILLFHIALVVVAMVIIVIVIVALFNISLL